VHPEVVGDIRQTRRLVVSSQSGDMSPHSQMACGQKTTNNIGMRWLLSGAS
jgi:hypothetical protein